MLLFHSADPLFKQVQRSVLHTLPNGSSCVTKNIVSVLRSKNIKCKVKLERLAELGHLIKKAVID